MDRYASGDDIAFGELHDALCPRLLGYIRHRVHDDALAEDLVQQTFLQMHCARGHFIRGAEVAPWAIAIARNLLFDSTRRRRTEARFAEADVPYTADYFFYRTRAKHPKHNVRCGATD